MSFAQFMTNNLKKELENLLYSLKNYLLTIDDPYKNYSKKSVNSSASLPKKVLEDKKLFIKKPPVLEKKVSPSPISIDTNIKKKSPSQESHVKPISSPTDTPYLPEIHEWIKQNDPKELLKIPYIDRWTFTPSTSQIYREGGNILYHSAEEKSFCEKLSIAIEERFGFCQLIHIANESLISEIVYQIKHHNISLIIMSYNAYLALKARLKISTSEAKHVFNHHFCHIITLNSLDFYEKKSNKQTLWNAIGLYLS